jgi:hypothetical protein
MEATTTKFATQKTIMTNAHAIAKTLDTAVKYAKRLGIAIKMAWAKVKTVAGVVMKEYKAETSWHKATDKVAMTYAQLEYINKLRNEENCPNWIFGSSTNAMRSITKFEASNIIDALKNGEKIVF